ncbi:hypothetical protein [Rhizobium sp. MHM7A]|uniref:hypothetical protein n=1 Tax=Rhizobium sp. MHM7A TaxID=2583233 RepID=UPI00110705F8|nr:hypothetical protein [Rhizobium sp. MHM7A]TLX15901.1 hypothetical protein FFR93_00885 [Rhizobium sp. MHM7A]
MTDERDIISEAEAAVWGGDSQLIDLHIVDDEIVGTVPIERLGLMNPLEKSPWYDGAGVTREGVQAAIDAGRLEASPYPGYSFSGESEWDRVRHEERIAYLTVNKDDRPISIEFVDASGDTLEIDDGWHRLAAAIMRDEHDIKVAVGGYFRHSVMRLGAICRAYCVLGSPEAAETYWQGMPLESTEPTPFGG